MPSLNSIMFELPWALLLWPLPWLISRLTPPFRQTGTALKVPFFQRLLALSGQPAKSGAVVVSKGRAQKLALQVAWALLIVALCRPVHLAEPIVQQQSSRDLLLLVDLSGSMSEQDFTNPTGEKISRLDAVKAVLGGFIEERAGDRIGLALFGSAAFPQAPFTNDHETVLTLLDELQVGMAGPRTMIGDAIGLAVRLFEASDGGNKVAILLTDGNDTGSAMPVVKAAQIAADDGITLHAVAIGDPANVGEQAIDIATLQTITAATGGQVFVAIDRDQLARIYETIDALEPAKLETLSYQPKQPLFHYPLGAMLLWMLAFSLGLQRAAAGRSADGDSDGVGNRS
ncbi:VWA domain-containing protein [Gammaproteobacteria bacterium]|nr:VWA domain-containing protein [Gammaproteobacteria bacterium]